MLFYIISVMFLMQCSIAKRLYVLEVRGERPVKDNEGYFVEGLHQIEKRHVFGVETSKPSGVQSKGQTVIIVPNEGQNYPSNSYPSNPQHGNNGGSKETTVVVTSSDNNNGNNKYRG